MRWHGTHRCGRDRILCGRIEVDESVRELHALPRWAAGDATVQNALGYRLSISFSGVSPRAAQAAVQGHFRCADE
jgi:hypothetical protein